MKVLQIEVTLILDDNKVTRNIHCADRDCEIKVIRLSNNDIMINSVNSNNIITKELAVYRSFLYYVNKH